MTKKRETIFDIKAAIKQWCREQGHDGFYCTDLEDETCGCSVEDLASCGADGMFLGIVGGICRGGKRVKKKFVDSDGNECDWVIVPHDLKGKLKLK